jgi:phosphatidylglycerophosphate synthase
MAEAIPSIAQLRTLCQEHKWASSRGLTRFNRYLSVYVTRLMIRTHATANSITLASILVGLAGSALFLASAWSFRVTGVGLLYLSFLLDQVDGEVARYWQNTSLTGSFLDELRHILIYSTPMFAVSLRLVMDGAPPLVAGAGFASALCLGVLRFSRNAKYLLVAKKLLAAANGPIQRQPSVPSREFRRPMRTRRGFVGALSRSLSFVFYVTTNQVSLLLLLALFQLVSSTVVLEQRVVAYLVYSAVLTIVTVIDVFGISRTRLEHSCAQLMSELRNERA